MKICPYCHTEPPARTRGGYCQFCTQRLARIREMYRRTGTEFSVNKLHRTWRHWRHTRELDRLYFSRGDIR